MHEAGEAQCLPTFLYHVQRYPAKTVVYKDDLEGVYA